MLTSPSTSPSFHAASSHSGAYLCDSYIRQPLSKPSPTTFKKPPNRQLVSSPKSFPRQQYQGAKTQLQPSPDSVTKVASTTDVGTQYTPPDWPPTSSRSSLRQSSAIVEGPSRRSSPSKFGQPPSRKSPKVAPFASPVAPVEPRLRQTPKTSFNDAPASSRRSRSSTSPSDDSSESARQASPSKRHRLATSDAKVVPKDYTRCNERDLALIISDLLMDLIRVNDDIPLEEGQLTRFHSRVPPGISVRAYLERLTFHATLSPPLLLSMVNYIDTLCAKYPTFTINSLTVHRFLITAACCAAKSLSDAFWTNTQYAKVGGISLRELAMLEMELLIRMDWEMVPKPVALEELYINLVARSTGYRIEDEADSTGVSESMSSESAALQVA